MNDTKKIEDVQAFWIKPAKFYVPLKQVGLRYSFGKVHQIQATRVYPTPCLLCITHWIFVLTYFLRWGLKPS